MSRQILTRAYRLLPGALRRWLLAAALREIALRPCHVTGMHDPNHTDRYLCQEQQADHLDRVLAAAGLHVGLLSRELHPSRSEWCHRVPDRERDRERLRAVWRWAGVPITGELAEPGPDLPQPGDAELVYSVLSETFETWQVVYPRARAAGLPHLDRYWPAVDKLVEQGRAEHRDIAARRVKALTS